MGGKVKAQVDFLIKVFKLIVASNVCPGTVITEWPKYILYLHKKGWLRSGFEDGELTVIAAAYRVPDLDKKTLNVYPTEEKGDILYIPFMASVTGDRFLPKKILTRVLKKYPDVNRIAFSDYSEGEKLRVFERAGKEKEESNVIREESDTTRDTGVSGRPDIQAGDGETVRVGGEADIL